MTARYHRCGDPTSARYAPQSHGRGRGAERRAGQNRDGKRRWSRRLFDVGCLLYGRGMIVTAPGLYRRAHDVINEMVPSPVDSEDPRLRRVQLEPPPCLLPLHHMASANAPRSLDPVPTPRGSPVSYRERPPPQTRRACSQRARSAFRAFSSRAGSYRSSTGFARIGRTDPRTLDVT